MSDNYLNISLLQFNPEWENISVNLDTIEAYISKSLPTDLFILPEMFTTGFSMNCKALAEEMNGTTVAWMKKQALKYNIAICGSTIISEKEEIYNRFLFVTPDATAYYDKRHLFAMGGEQACYNSGNSQVVVNFRGWRIMLLICYDLRFPVWSRNKNNYDLVIYVANWPASRRKVWDTLLKARAIENQCYVAGCNRVGTDDRNIVYNGGSKIVDERGELINEDADNAQGIIHSKISLDRLHKFRDDFPVWKDADNFKIVD